MLQPEQLAEIALAVERGLARRGQLFGHQLIQPLFLELQFQFFIE